MKRFWKIFLFFIFTVILTSCISHKKVPYIQNSKELENMHQLGGLYEARIQPKDLLQITVANPLNQDAATPYNLVLPSLQTQTNSSTTSQPVLQLYLVDNDGNVEFPVVGNIHIGGLTKSQAEELIYSKIKDSFKEKPIVSIRFQNYKISVLGEVLKPGTYSISNEKVNIFEALALAGDMSIYGMRDNVKLIREDINGKKNVYELNLNEVEVIQSPYYYLQQNDVIYVTPNESKAKNSDVGTTTTLWFSATSILVSLTSLLYNILK